MQENSKTQGITTFGSCVIRAPADAASLTFSILRLGKRPRDAFSSVRETIKSLRKYFARATIDDVGSSRVTMTQEFQYSGGERKFIGYEAKVGFHVVLKDLDRIEEVLIGIIDAGVNVVESVVFQTRNLKELRKTARVRAVESAREKAEIYCKAAGVGVGRVLSIEDVNPDSLRGGESHVKWAVDSDDAAEVRAFDPGAISVNGAVKVSYAIVTQG